jgi:hypothetical protein
MTTENLTEEQAFNERVNAALSTNSILSYNDAKRLIRSAKLKTPEDYEQFRINSGYKEILPENPEEYYR